MNAMETGALEYHVIVVAGSGPLPENITLNVNGRIVVGH